MTYQYKIGDRSADPMTAVLPYEIVLTVFSFLPTEQLVECLNVSSFWRYRLLRSPSLWRELELREADARCVKELYQVANMATSMTIYGDADLTAAFDLLIKGKFESLKFLGLEIECPSDHLFKDSIYPALATVGSFLDQLAVSYLDSSKLSLEMVTDYCPNLTHLTYHGYNTSSSSSSTNIVRNISKDSNSSNRHIHLQYAYIHVDEQLDPNDLSCLLQRTRNLQRLNVSYCKPEILDTIFNCCPDIPYLNYNMPTLTYYNTTQRLKLMKNNKSRNNHADEDNWRRNKAYDVDDGNADGVVAVGGGGVLEKAKGGMQVLNIVNQGPILESDQILRFLTHNNTTLKEFGLTSRRDDGGLQQHQEMPNFAAMYFPDINNYTNTLRRFHCDAPVDATILSSVIRQCAWLEDIKLSNANTECLQHLVLCLTRRLRKLHLVGCQELQEQDMGTFLVNCKRTLSSGYSSCSMLSTDKSLTLEECGALTDTTLVHLADIPTLHTLVLKEINNITAAGIYTFFEKLSQTCRNASLNHGKLDSPLLKRIEFEHVKSLTDDALAKLDTVAPVESIVLKALHHITVKGIQKLVDGHAASPSSSLCRISVVDCNRIDNAELSSAVANSKVRIHRTNPLMVEESML